MEDRLEEPAGKKPRTTEEKTEANPPKSAPTPLRVGKTIITDFSPPSKPSLSPVDFPTLDHWKIIAVCSPSPDETGENALADLFYEAFPSLAGFSSVINLTGGTWKDLKGTPIAAIEASVPLEKTDLVQPLLTTPPVDDARFSIWNVAAVGDNNPIEAMKKVADLQFGGVPPVYWGEIPSQNPTEEELQLWRKQVAELAATITSTSPFTADLARVYLKGAKAIRLGNSWGISIYLWEPASRAALLSSPIKAVAQKPTALRAFTSNPNDPLGSMEVRLVFEKTPPTEPTATHRLRNLCGDAFLYYIGENISVFNTQKKSLSVIVGFCNKNMAEFWAASFLKNGVMGHKLTKVEWGGAPPSQNQMPSSNRGRGRGFGRRGRRGSRNRSFAPYF